MNQQSPSIPKEVEAHYLETKESERLSGAHGELERLRTLEILARALPPAPAVIFDIGGAAGAYAFPLSGQGYVVHLIDPVEIHLEQAKARSAASVKPKGVLIAAAISRFASLIDGLARGFFRDSDFRKIVTSDLATGQHRNPTNQTAYFTTAYFHRPEELAAEVREASFADIQIFAVEGPVWSTAHLGEAWDDPVQRKSLMEFLALIERESSAHGASAHLVAVAHAT